MKEILGEAAYLERCAKRTRAVLDFSTSDEFYEHILLGSLSSIPRWRYAASLDAVDREPGTARSDKALMDLLDSTREIICGKNFLVEHLVSMDKNPLRIRLTLYTSLMRTALYLSEKNIGVALFDRQILT